MKSAGTARRTRLAIAVVILTLSLMGLVFRGAISTAVAPVAAPLTSAGTWITSRFFWWTQARNISPKELEALHESVTQSRMQIVELTQLREENATLRAQLNFIERTQTATVAAAILSKHISATTSRFVIDVGQRDGIEAGAAVVAQDGVFIGKVTDVGIHSATVMALNDPMHSVAVSLLNENKTIGVASGTVGDLLRIDFIPVDEPIQAGELVVTSGLEDTVASGLLVGVVNAVVQEPGSAFQQAVVEPLADIRRLSSVLVLRMEQSQYTP